MSLFDMLSGAKGIRASGAAAQEIDNYNAAVAKQQAEAERIKSKFASIRHAKKAEEIKGALTAKLAGAGGLGSPVAGDLEAEQAAELELENLLIGYEGEVAARRAESQAELDILQGKAAKLKSKSAARAANIQFGTQLATMPVGSKGGSLLTGFN